MTMVRAKHQYRIALLLICFLLTPQFVVSATQRKGKKKPVAGKNTDASALDSLRAAIQKALADDAYSAARWGVKISALDSDKVIYETDANKLFNPASNMKLYTTITALDRLGADFRTRTSLYAAAEPDNGTIKGDLIFYGRGDGNLSGRFNNGNQLKPLEDLADQLKSRGVKKIDGNIVGDDSYFNSDLVGYGWEADDLRWRDGAEVSALAINENTIDLKVTPGAKLGDPCAIVLEPANSYITVVNRTTTVETGHKLDLGIHRGLEDNIIEVWGTIAVGDKGNTYHLAVHNPALYAANLLKDLLNRRGIEVKGNAISVHANDHKTQPTKIDAMKEIASLTSIPLSEEVAVINKESNNLHAEILLRQLGVKFGTRFVTGSIERTAAEGPIPTDELGASVVKDLLKQAGVDPAVLTIKDGSGLSRHDLVTPAATLAILRYAARQTYAEALFNSLPIGGVDGTLKRRFASTVAANNLHAKTGTLSYVNGLSGYVTTARGDRVVFSIMINNRTAQGSSTAAMDAVCLLLAEYKGKL